MQPTLKELLATGADAAPAISAPSRTALTFGGLNIGTNTVSGIISDGTGGGAVSLTKTGSGNLTLSGTNTYTGATVANGGVVFYPMPGANTTPWQLEGTILALRRAGFTDLVCVQNQTVVTNAFKGEDLNGYVPIFRQHNVPALEAADADCPATDQRGEPRDTPCDLGAFESE